MWYFSEVTPENELINSLPVWQNALKFHKSYKRGGATYLFLGGYLCRMIQHYDP